MEGEDLAKLLGKKHRYVILLEMYPAEKSYVTELASALDIDRRNLGRYLEGLQKADLVIFNEEKRMEGGKPYRYYCLTESGRKIVSVFTNVTTKVTKLKPEKWQIDKIIGLLKNEKLSANLREIAVHRFFSFCQEDPVYLTKDKKVKKIFEDTVENPTQFDDKVRERLRASVSTSFPRLLADKDRGMWVLEKLYPWLIRCLEDETKDDKIRTWALRLIGDVCRIGADKHIREEARERIFETYFSNEMNSDSKLVEEAKRELVELASKELFEKIQEKIQGDDLEKTKAMILMEEMIRNFSFRK